MTAVVTINRSQFNAAMSDTALRLGLLEAALV